MSWRETGVLIAAVAVLIGACAGQGGKPDDRAGNGDAMEDSVAAVVREAKRELDSLGESASERVAQLAEDIEEEQVVQTAEEAIDEAVQAAQTQVDSLAERMEREGTAGQLGRRVDRVVANARDQVNTLLEQLQQD